MTRPTLLPATAALCLTLASVASAGTLGVDQRPQPRPTQPATLQPAKLTTGEGISSAPAAPSATDPWGAKRYEKVWRTGDKIGDYNFHLLAAWKRYKLPRLPQGQVYVALGRQVLSVNARDWTVVSSIGDVSTIIG